MAERRDVRPERIDTTLAAEHAVAVLHEKVFDVDPAARGPVHTPLGLELRDRRVGVIAARRAREGSAFVIPPDGALFDRLEARRGAPDHCAEHRAGGQAHAHIEREDPGGGLQGDVAAHVGLQGEGAGDGADPPLAPALSVVVGGPEQVVRGRHAHSSGHRVSTSFASWR